MAEVDVVQEDIEQVVDPLAEIDDTDLSEHLMRLVRDDKRDKEDFGWVEKRQYDERAYYGHKPKVVTTPWKNAANYHVHLTRTLVDTAHANIMGSIFANPEDTVDVRGIGPEDVRKESSLESLMNFIISNEVGAYAVMDKAVHYGFRQGTGIVKAIQDAETGSVRWVVVPAENIFCPIDAKGFQVHQADHVFEIIPLSENYYEEMKSAKDENGEPFYDKQGMDDIPKGFRIANSSAREMITQIRDAIFGTDLKAKESRDYRYIIEAYCTYWYKPKAQDSDYNAEKKKVELVVWFSPATTKILRKVINKGKTIVDKKTGKEKSIVKRPYALCVPDPSWDRIWGVSLPERLRETQEELNYSHNQNINAADLAIRPMVLYPESQNINPEDYKSAPGVWAPVPDPKAVEVLRIQADPIFERQEERYWDLAERDTGLTDLFQGREVDPNSTLGANVIRQNKTEIRFKSTYLRIEEFWKELLELTYYYVSIYTPSDKKIKILGTADFKTLKELFPDGIDGNYDFGFSSAPLTERAQAQQDKKDFCMGMFANPLVVNDVKSLWNVTKIYAEATNQRNLEGIVTKPDDANVLSPEQAIQRIVSGQEVIPMPQINGEAYVLQIQMFMMSEQFTEATPEIQQRMIQLLQRASVIRQGQLQAKLDAQILMSRMAQMGQLPQQPGQPQGNQQPQEVAQ